MSAIQFVQSISKCRFFSRFYWHNCCKYRGTSNLVFSSTAASPLSTAKQTELMKRAGKKKRAVDHDKMRKGFWNVVAYSTAKEYHLEDLKLCLKKHNIETTALSKDLKNLDFLHAIVTQDVKPNTDQEPQEVFIYREGAIVTWNVPEIDIEVLLSLLCKCDSGTYPDDIVRDEREMMCYAYSEALSTKIMDDDIMLSTSVECGYDKYAVSNAMALSVKLGTWEAILSRYVDSMENVTEDLKLGNKIKMSQAEVMQKTGELFMLRHELNLSSDLLDTPDVYWDREKLENVFQMTFNYFNINKRTRVMNEKLNHCIELVELLSSHLRDNHHVRLEWMIIVLIMVEVAFEILHHIERKNESPNDRQTV